MGLLPEGMATDQQHLWSEKKKKKGCKNLAGGAQGTAWVLSGATAAVCQSAQAVSGWMPRIRTLVVSP